MKRELRVFLGVGLTTVGIDLAVYSALLALGAAIGPAKAAGFVAGMVFAYFANKAWTFKAGSTGVASGIAFAAIYGLSLAANVWANAVSLDFAQLLVSELPAKGFAFVVSTGFSATLNFLGMKFVAFNRAIFPVTR